MEGRCHDCRPAIRVAGPQDGPGHRDSEACLRQGRTGRAVVVSADRPLCPALPLLLEMPKGVGAGAVANGGQPATPRTRVQEMSTSKSVSWMESGVGAVGTAGGAWAQK